MRLPHARAHLKSSPSQHHLALRHMHAPPTAPPVCCAAPAAIALIFNATQLGGVAAPAVPDARSPRCTKNANCCDNAKKTSVVAIDKSCTKQHEAVEMCFVRTSGLRRPSTWLGAGGMWALAGAWRGRGRAVALALAWPIIAKG